MSGVLSVLRRAKPPAVPPGRLVYAVGDIHGRADLLENMLAQIETDRRSGPVHGAPTIVFIGDYVDRGLRSRDVIERILALASEGYEPIFLKGNHEAAMLTFMDQPQTGPTWFALGGAETLYSYGVAAPKPTASPTVLRFAARALRAAMPPTHLNFLARLKLHAQLGNYLFVHAGLRPGESLEKQTETDMLEIRAPFLNSRRRWPFVIVHGHTPVESVDRKKTRIAIDTGAYATGKLSALRLEGDGVKVLTT